jgi:hypothetical protein
MSESTFRSEPRLRFSCRGKSLVSGVTTARADALELILRGLEGAQLSGAERRLAAPEETQDEGSVAAQLLGGVVTAVGVWRRKSGAVSPTFNACDASVSRSQPTRRLYDT